MYVFGEPSESIISYDAKIVPFSDHGFVAPEILVGGPRDMRQRHDTPWKINASFLDSEDFTEETKHALEGVPEGGADVVCWENYKTVFCDSARVLGLRKSAEDQQARTTSRTYSRHCWKRSAALGPSERTLGTARSSFGPSWKSGIGRQKSKAEARHLKERLTHQRATECCQGVARWNLCWLIEGGHRQCLQGVLRRTLPESSTGEGCLRALLERVTICSGQSP